MIIDQGMNMRRFYLRAVGLVCIIAGFSSLRLDQNFVAGVMTGGALAIINVRQMHKGLLVLLSIERPNAMRLWFSGILRLGILCSVIVVIAYMRLVNMLGLLIGFALVPALLMIEGLLYARSLTGDEVDPSAPSCDTKFPK